MLKDKNGPQLLLRSTQNNFIKNFTFSAFLTNTNSIKANPHIIVLLGQNALPKAVNEKAFTLHTRARKK